MYLTMGAVAPLLVLQQRPYLRATVPRLLGVVDPSFRAPSGRLTVTGRLYRLNKDSLCDSASLSARTTAMQCRYLCETMRFNRGEH